MIKPATIAAYRAALYQVDYQVTSGAFTLRPDVACPELAALYRATGEHCALFITAWNPGSVPHSAVANSDANLRLHARLAAVSRHVIPGHGIDPNGEWPAEASFLVLGIDQPASRALGAEFRQNAILWADAAAIPRLILLR